MSHLVVLVSGSSLLKKSAVGGLGAVASPGGSWFGGRGGLLGSRQSTFGSFIEGLVEFVPSRLQMLPVPPHASGQPLLEIMRGGVAEKG